MSHGGNHSFLRKAIQRGSDWFIGDYKKDAPPPADLKKKR